MSYRVFLFLGYRKRIGSERIYCAVPSFRSISLVTLAARMLQYRGGLCRRNNFERPAGNGWQPAGVDWQPAVFLSQLANESNR